MLPLPRLPFVSRPTRTTMDLLGAGDSALQVQVVFSCLHFGQSSFLQLSFPIGRSQLFLNTTTRTSIGRSILRNSSSMIALVCSWLKPPDPAPISGKAIDRKPCSAAKTSALRTESRIDRSEARHSMLIPATWMMALNGNRPADVRTAPPSGIGPCLRSSLNGPVPPRFLIAPDTPCRHSRGQPTLGTAGDNAAQPGTTDPWHGRGQRARPGTGTAGDNRPLEGHGRGQPTFGAWMRGDN